MSIRSLNPLIDGDLLVYRCGFAPTAEEQVENSLHLVGQTLRGILSEFPDRKYYRLFISGKENFREAVSVTRIYKGNRDAAHKPKYYNEIKYYMLDFWNAQVVNGREPDDALGCAQWEAKDRSTCIVTTDKDLNMIPGHHYNWVKREFKYITLPEANRWFWVQLLAGDSTDNIQGIPGLGYAKAERLVPQDAPVEELISIVMDQYTKAYGENGPEVAKEMAKLVWMQRKEGKFDPWIVGN